MTITTTSRLVEVRAQVQLTGKGCFSSVEARNATSDKKVEEIKEGFATPEIAGKTSIDLWGGDGVDFNLKDDSTNANIAGIAVQLNFDYDSDDSTIDKDGTGP